MIFRRREDFASLVFLEPVLRELKLRKPEIEINIECNHPELFTGLKHIKQAAIRVDFPGEIIVDLDGLDVFAKDTHLIDTFALAILGDTRLQSRRTYLVDGEPCPALMDWPKNQENAVICSFDDRFIGTSTPFILDFLNEASEIFTIGVLRYPRELKLPEKVTDLSLIAENPAQSRWAIERARMYLGFDENITYLAMATNIPMVVLYSFRPANKLFPFRRGIPFIALSSQPDTCPLLYRCLEQNTKKESGTFQYLSCPRPEKFSCLKGFSGKLLTETLIALKEKL